MRCGETNFRGLFRRIAEAVDSSPTARVAAYHSITGDDAPAGVAAPDKLHQTGNRYETKQFLYRLRENPFWRSGDHIIDNGRLRGGGASATTEAGQGVADQ